MGGAGALLQLISFIVAILGVIAGFAAFGDYGATSSGVYLIVASLLGGLFFFGVGGAFVALEDIQKDTRRSATANERIVQAVEQLLLRDIYATKRNDVPSAARTQETAIANQKPEALSLIQDIEASPPVAKPRGTILRRLDDEGKPKKSTDSK